MIFIFLFILTFPINCNECKHDCYLGAGLYSRPVNSDNCCGEKTNSNCFSYSEKTPNEFLCKQCKTGFIFTNEGCKKVKKWKKCINPESPNEIGFQKCKVCKITNNNILVPIWIKGKLKCKKPIEQTVALPNFNNCLASAFHAEIFFCHECKNGYYFDEYRQACASYKNNKKMEGCLVSFLWKRCDICREGYQFKQSSYSCIHEKDIKKQETKNTRLESVPDL